MQADSRLDLAVLQAIIWPDTTLVSVIMVNNKTGVIQAEITHAAEMLFMTDTNQAVVGKLSIDMEALGIDLLTFSSHKLYVPKGMGGLCIRQRRPSRVRLAAMSAASA